MTIIRDSKLFGDVLLTKRKVVKQEQKLDKISDAEFIELFKDLNLNHVEMKNPRNKELTIEK